MGQDPFEQKIKSFQQVQNTVVMEDVSQRIQMNLNFLRDIVEDLPRPSGDCAHVRVIVKGESYWFPLRHSIMIGAYEDNDIQLEDEYISGKHCEIKKQNHHWYLVDLESRNGVYINGNRVRDRLLEDRDIIQLGDSSLIFVLPDESN